MAKAARAESETVGDSLRDDMEAAFDKLEAGGQPEEVIDAGPEHTEVEEAPETQTEAPEKIPETPEGSDPSELRAEVDKPKPAAEAKPPVDWSPALREHWGKLPPEVRQKIADRERHIAVTMQETTAARHLANDFIRAIEPYRGLMAAEGVQNPIQAVEGLMRVTAVLSMGAPQQKAERIAGLVKHYGVDIELLDQALAGSLPAPDPNQQAFQRMLDERMAPVNQLLSRLGQAEQQQGQQMYGQAQQSIEQFGADPKNEFFEDVRYDMADFLDMAAQRGVSMSLKEAYDRACALHPEIQQVIAKRNPVSIQDKRRAATSLPSRGSSGGGKGEMSLRDEIASHFPDEGRIQ